MSKSIKLILVVVVAIIFFVVLGIFQSESFRLTGSTPKLENTLPTSTGTIKLNFSHDVDASIDYASTVEGDTEIVQRVTVESKSILIKLKPLIKDKNYTLSIKDVKSKDGKIIRNIPINFTATYVPYNQLGEDQKKLELSETDKNNIQDPLLSIVPYQGERFYLTSEYTATEEGEPILVLNIQLFLTRSDIGSGRQSAIDRYKFSVREYLISKNLNIDDYFVRYEINEPPARTD